MKNKGLAALALSAIALTLCFPLLEGAQTVKAAGIEGTSLPEGWAIETLDDTGLNEITSPYLGGVAYKDGAKGNSLKLSRRQSAYKLYALSDSFAAEADTSYKVEFYYRNECLDDPENVLSVTILETKTDGSTVSAVVASKSGRVSTWAYLSGYYSTSEDCESLEVRISAEGYGDYFVTDMSLRGRPAPIIPLSNYSMSRNGEESTPYSDLSVSDLTDDCYRGERALALDNSGFRSRLGFLPVGYYTMSFRYRSNAGERVSIRLDNVTMAGARSWSADPIKGKTEGWVDYSYRFQKSATVSCDISWYGIYAYNDYVFDDIAIYDEDGFNYVTNGTYEGYDLDGITLIGNASISENKDGTLNYAGSYNNFHLSREAAVELDSSKMNLESGKEYTLSYEVRNGNGDSCGAASYNGSLITSGVGWDPSPTWVRKEGKFTAVDGKNLTLSLGQSGVEYLCYIRNVSIKDEEGNECNVPQPKVHTTDESQIGDNIFSYGSFAYTFDDSGSSSSSSSSFSDDSFDGDDSSESASSSSIWTPSSPSSSTPTSSPDNGSKGDSSSSDSNAGLFIGIGVCLVALATAGLVVSIVLLTKKGKKHD